MSDAASPALSATSLTEGDVLLRPPTSDDTAAMTRACQDPDVQRWTAIPVPYETHHAEEFIARMSANGPGWQLGQNPGWVISQVARPGEYDGFLDLRLDGTGAAEVGYSVAPWARGRGLATGAVRAACRYAFDQLHLARVSWYANVGNDASRRVAGKAGFQILPGTLRQALVARGVRHDAWVGDLLPGDLR